jgi:hypothetical protein
LSGPEFPARRPALGQRAQRRPEEDEDHPQRATRKNHAQNGLQARFGAHGLQVIAPRLRHKVHRVRTLPALPAKDGIRIDAHFFGRTCSFPPA